MLAVITISGITFVRAPTPKLETLRNRYRYCYSANLKWFSRSLLTTVTPFPMSIPYKIYILCAISLVLIFSFIRWSQLSFDANASVSFAPTFAKPSPPETVPSFPPPPPPPAQLEPIAITLVLMGEGVVHEGSVAIKSAIMYTSRPLHFHLICTEDNIAYMEKKFALFPRPAYAIEVRISVPVSPALIF